MDFKLVIEPILQQAGNIFLQYLKAELVLQGHNNTGKLLESLVWNIDGDTVDVVGLFYAKILDKGFGPEKASFKQAPFLIKYFKTKGKSDEVAKAMAFATINKWKKTGMPTQGKSKLAAISKAIKKSEKQIDAFITKELSKKISVLLQKTLT